LKNFPNFLNSLNIDKNFNKFKLFSRKALETLGKDKLIFLATNDSISEKTCQIIASIPNLLNGIELKNLLDFLNSLNIDKNFNKFKIFSYFHLIKMGREKLIDLATNDSINEETCKNVAVRESNYY
jgi:hypothetical protein